MNREYQRLASERKRLIEERDMYLDILIAVRRFEVPEAALGLSAGEVSILEMGKKERSEYPLVLGKGANKVSILDIGRFADLEDFMGLRHPAIQAAIEKLGPLSDYPRYVPYSQRKRRVYKRTAALAQKCMDSTNTRDKEHA